MKVLTKLNEYKEIVLPSGTTFNGSVLTQTETLVIAISLVPGEEKRIKKLKSAMTAQDEQDAIDILKLAKIDEITNDSVYDFNHIEYPTSSGNTFPVTIEKYAIYNAMMLYNANLVYPYTFFGNGTSKVVAADATELQAFVGGILAGHQLVYNGKFIPKIEDVEAVELGVAPNNTFDDAVATLVAIQY